jgi:hypothetical protein
MIVFFSHFYILKYSRFEKNNFFHNNDEKRMIEFYFFNELQL